MCNLLTNAKQYLNIFQNKLQSWEIKKSYSIQKIKNIKVFRKFHRAEHGRMSACVLLTCLQTLEKNC